MICFPSESDSESTSESSDGKSSQSSKSENIGTFDNDVWISKRRIRRQQWRNSKRRLVCCPSSSSSSSTEDGLVEANHNNENSEGNLDVETNGALHEPEPAEEATNSNSGESRSSHASEYQNDTGNKSSSSLSGDSSDSENKQSGQVSENESDESSSFSEEELDLPLYEGSDLSRKGFLSLFLALSKSHGMSEKTKEDILKFIKVIVPSSQHPSSSYCLKKCVEGLLQCKNYKHYVICPKCSNEADKKNGCGNEQCEDFNRPYDLRAVDTLQTFYINHLKPQLTRIIQGMWIYDTSKKSRYM